MQMQIIQMRREAQGVMSLELTPVGNEAPVEWEPGAHIDLILPSGLARQYSLCGSCTAKDVYRIAVLREAVSRGGSIEVHDVLRVGDIVEVGGPRNHFRLVPARHYIFIAGGIGITPILPMIECAEAQGTPWELHYFGRSRETMSFVEHLRTFGDKISILPSGEKGATTVASLIEARPEADVYCCGPERLIEAVMNACETAAMAERCHLERFSPVVLDEPEGGPTAFTAILASSGKRIEVPADKSLLNCLLDHGADVLFSCEEGTCGSCRIGVLEGCPQHRDSVLSPGERAANNTMMPCVSRSVSSTLVLDL